MSVAVHSAVTSSGFAVVPSADINPTVSKKQQQVLFMKWFVSLSPRQYGVMRGKKLNIFEKLSLKPKAVVIAKALIGEDWHSAFSWD